MKLKYYLLGLGIGIFVTTLVLSIGNKKKKLSDDEIIARARELGMEMKDERKDNLEDVIEKSLDKSYDGPAENPDESSGNDNGASTDGNTTKDLLPPETSDEDKKADEPEADADKDNAKADDLPEAAMTDYEASGNDKAADAEKTADGGNTAGKNKNADTEKNADGDKTTGKDKATDAEKTVDGDNTAGKNKTADTDKNIAAGDLNLPASSDVKDETADKADKANNDKTENDRTEKAGNTSGTDENIETDEIKLSEEADTKNETDGNSGEADYVTFTIKRGMTSYQVAELLYEKGLIDNVKDFDKYIISKGKASVIRIGTYTLPKNSSYQEILNTIT